MPVTPVHRVPSKSMALWPWDITQLNIQWGLSAIATNRYVSIQLFIFRCQYNSFDVTSRLKVDKGDEWKATEAEAVFHRRIHTADFLLVTNVMEWYTEYYERITFDCLFYSSFYRKASSASITTCIDNLPAQNIIHAKQLIMIKHSLNFVDAKYHTFTVLRKLYSLLYVILSLFLCCCFFF